MTSRISKKGVYFLGKIEKIVTFLEEWTLFISVISAMVALFINIILRYCFNSNLPWSEEFVREVIIYTTFIGCSLAIKKGAEIKIDATIYLFPWLKNKLNVLSRIATFIFSFFLIYYGSKMAIMMHTSNQKTIVLKIPLVILYSVLPISGLFMSFRVIYSFLHPGCNKE
ncbi:hypothetical protein JCM13304A_06010 [Desulfothermus okinawensis JCM 13304]